MNRRDKTNYYLDMAQVALERGTCLRRNFGAVIVKNDVIVSTGYTGAPRGRANCIDIGTCVRQKMGIPRGERYEFCRSVHAEANAIIAAPREQMLGATLYLVGRDMSTGEIMPDANSCTMCKRMIINAGISHVVIRRDNDTPGITRDRIFANCEWSGHEFLLVDTGGIEPKATEGILAHMREQAQIAIDTADCIIMVVDVRNGLTAADEDVAHMLRRSHKPIILAVNKCDNVGETPMELYEFYNLGFDEVMPISSVHGHGTGDLLDAVCAHLDFSETVVEEDRIPVAIIGRPNVGKSSLTNRILGENRMIVANEAGTTRDAIDTPVDNAYGKFIFTDTAGLRKRSNITDGLERYMVVRALAAVERSRVALILVDATVGFTEQDSKVAGYAHDQGKACIIVVNKWDAVEGKETNTMELQRRGYAECFSFMGYAPIIFISAQTGYNVNKLMQLIRDVDSQNGARVPTGVLNEMLARATARMQPPSDKGRRLKIFYLTQASTRPPTFVAFVNAKHLFHFSYQRYIINQIRENFGLEHTPIRLVVRERGSGEVGAKDV